MLERLRNLGGEGDPRPPGALGRGRMRRRLRQRQRVREALLLDLGALVYELHRQGERRPELLQAKAADLTVVDREVRALSDALQVGQAELQLVAAGITGSCPSCGELLTTDTRYCPQCGIPAAPALTARHEAAERPAELGGQEERRLEEAEAEGADSAGTEEEPAVPVAPETAGADRSEGEEEAAEDEAPTREHEALEAAVGDVAAGARAASEAPADGTMADGEPEGRARRVLRRARSRIRSEDDQ